MDEAGKKLVSVRDEVARGERERKELEKTIGELRAELEQAHAAAVSSHRAADDAREELETIRVMSAQSFLEVRQEITRAREQAAEEVHRVRSELEAARARDTLLKSHCEELEELLRLLGAGLREEEQRLGELEESVRTVHQHAHSIPDPKEMERELVRHAMDGREREHALALREQRLERLTAELGERDAELAILHGAVASTRRQMAELVGMICKTREQVLGRTGLEVAAALDRLAAEATELTGRP
jgi:chromosome segregation ATPase